MPWGDRYRKRKLQFQRWTELLADQDGNIRKRVADALGKIGAEAKPAVPMH
jgi:HEAT repeat protein